MDTLTSAPQPLEGLLEFAGTPAEFWRRWTEAALDQLQGQLAVLYLRPLGEPGQDPLADWTVLLAAPEAAAARPEALPSLAATVDPALLAQARQQRMASGVARQGNWNLRLISVRPEGAAQELLLSVHVPAAVRADHTAHWLGLLAMAPHSYELTRNHRRVARDLDRQKALQETLWRVLEAERFDQASLVFANELCERFGCEQVSLLWQKRAGLRLSAVSHGDKLDRRTELTELLEDAGQEALTQWQEVAWPTEGGGARAHQAYAEAVRPGHLLSLPLVIGDQGVGAVVLERRPAAFSQSEQWALRLLCDQMARPLRDLHRQAAPLWRRLPREVFRSLPRRLSATTRPGRWLAGGLALAALLLLALPVPYRIHAPVEIRTDRIAFVGAPFDGYIESSAVTLGSTVRAGAPLFALATQELQLERVSHLADIAQYVREAEKRLAAGQLVEMRIAEAQVAQTQARLDQVEYRLRSAAVVAPSDGIVVEGEPGKSLGGAVRRGEMVVKVAALAGLFAQLAVDERDIHRLREGMTTEVTLTADPHTAWHMRVTRVIPAAAVKDGVNTFPVRAEAEADALPPDWWRPGMSGVARINAGHRSLGWIISHRLVDYLRLALWM
ncbi:efflux RND transporter periplasmic adaptor subunit [Sediminicoccus sp. KRV36]|uniref:efflux RND transporter periplasmic adaptor subunit n=1 Tax=Sediminicoccus sp. KRV36 TaxID=3133721 RepID=UPI00200CAE71|nr:efflux RND transporter periplasmic adaptor subunit [Sediminicoccus rosea]UPY37837.1 efflux RND transporter periplasmic adaptor subunit [Sediminicoccus rosea]